MKVSLLDAFIEFVLNVLPTHIVGEITHLTSSMLSCMIQATLCGVDRTLHEGGPDVPSLWAFRNQKYTWDLSLMCIFVYNTLVR